MKALEEAKAKSDIQKARLERELKGEADHAVTLAQRLKDLEQEEIADKEALETLSREQADSTTYFDEQVAALMTRLEVRFLSFFYADSQWDCCFVGCSQAARQAEQSAGDARRTARVL